MAITENTLSFLKKKLEYAVAFVVFLFFFALSITQTGTKIEWGFYDTLLAIKPPVSERKEILFIDIDDNALEQMGAWPWSRDLYADTLIRLREVGGKRIVFDIEYLSQGQAGVNRAYVKTEFPAAYNEVHSEIVQNLEAFSDAIATKSIPVSAVPEYSSEMTGYIDERMNDLSGSITANIFQDNDLYFGKAIKFFGQAYLTINYAPININEESKLASAYARENFMFTNIVDQKGLIARDNLKSRAAESLEEGIAPAILPLLSNAAGAGFPNVIIDEDGVRRRIELLSAYEGAYIGQLVFAPILDLLEPEQIIRQGQRLVLVNARDPNNLESGIRKSITIPLDEKGNFLINWLKKKFIDPINPSDTSFRHISVYELQYSDKIETKLIDNLDSIESLVIKNAEGYLSYHDAVLWVKAAYKDLTAWKNGLLEGQRSDYDEYFSARTEFFRNYGEFLEGGFDTEIYDTLDRFTELTGNTKYSAFKESIQKNFDIYRNEYKQYLSQMEELKKICNGSFAIFGNTAVGSTDLGVNPFAKSYANVGTHANVYNTIMTGEFINPLPVWVSWLTAFLFCYLSALAYRRIKSLKFRIVYGVLSSVFTFAFITVLFAFLRIYIQLFVPLLSVFVSFLLVSIFKFVFSEQEKSFLRKAFTMYLSTDVVNEIVADPSKLKLGGQEKQITALFTDIKSFSTLSEKVTPEHLVQILNKYLTVMSDIVLEQKGTIDKYIGDAIVAFFGAPLDLPDHAARACLAGVRMKEAEKLLNEELLAGGDVPMPILTRIGINSGPMVVGNMGTDNKMNYTIMGNDVNLAARLEGVNKSYGSWILVSESTWKQTGDQFLGRKFDRVRVVGIDTPVQLYNILGVRSEASAQKLALVEKFNTAIDAYREKKFSEALIHFTKCTEIDPDDSASVIFRDRVRDMMKATVGDDWSDVINMTSK